VLRTTIYLFWFVYFRFCAFRSIAFVFFKCLRLVNVVQVSDQNPEMSRTSKYSETSVYSAGHFSKIRISTRLIRRCFTANRRTNILNGWDRTWVFPIFRSVFQIYKSWRTLSLCAIGNREQSAIIHRRSFEIRRTTRRIG